MISLEYIDCSQLMLTFIKNVMVNDYIFDGIEWMSFPIYEYRFRISGYIDCFQLMLTFIINDYILRFDGIG